VFGQRTWYAPGWVRLIEKNDAPRDHKATEPEAAPRPREFSLNELDAAKSVGAFLAEEAKDAFDIRLAGWMMAVLSGVLANDTREGSGDFSDGRRDLSVNPYFLQLAEEGALVAGIATASRLNGSPHPARRENLARPRVLASRHMPSGRLKTQPGTLYIRRLYRSGATMASRPSRAIKAEYRDSTSVPSLDPNSLIYSYSTIKK
jgi:hypothetical protein